MTDDLKNPAADVGPGPLPGPTSDLTPDQAAAVATGLFRPTIRRMEHLIGTLIAATQSGDFALWAPLGAMDETLRQLRFDASTPYGALHTQRLLALVSFVLREYARKIDDHRAAVDACLTAGAPLPPYPTWDESDTLHCYDTIQALYPNPSSAPPSPGDATTPPKEPTTDD